MRITIIAVGSRGDVQPYVALGSGLKAAGHTVRLATHANFETFVRGRGLDFAPIEGNPRELVGTEAGQAMLGAGSNPMRFVRGFMRVAGPLMQKFFADSWNACQGAQAVIYSALGFAGYHVAEKLGVPSCAAYLQPVTPTHAFPSTQVNVSLRLGGAYNWLTHVFAEQLIWQPLRPMVNRWRAESLGLPPLPFWGPFRRLHRERHPILYGYSPTVLPKPPDWSDWLHVTGYWFLDQEVSWRPPADLVGFLRAGPPPVYIGFGSMSNRDAEGTTRLVLEALALSRQRGILLSGWGGLRKADLPGTTFMIDSIPHGWLFPQMAAVVHHGGAGTTAAGLRAGVPSILIPFFGDQPFWGRRVMELGVGPQPIPRQQLSAERLAAAITAAVTEEDLRARAVRLGQQLRAEDGVARAVEAFQQHVKNGRA